MGPGEYLTILSILVAFLGVLLVAFLGLEWLQLRGQRNELKTLEARLARENRRAIAAAHRVIASYGLSDLDARISLLKSALAQYPHAFNAWNSLGYAFQEKGEIAKAIDAFHQAIAAFPEDKAGYCDLAAAYLRENEPELAWIYCLKAMEVDASAREELLNDARFRALHSRISHP